MADAVRHVMESMVPEMDALHERGLFTRDELKEVLKRRTEFEYATRKPGGKTELAEFLRYIEYETKLEELRKLRMKTPKAIEAIKKDKVKRRTKGKAEFCIVRRMHFIFARAIKKFSGDVRLWKSYFDFCKAYGGSRTFSRMLAKALQLHPNKPGMWLEAAAWELNGHHNETAARALLQQGLRICTKAKILWLEYFKFELLIARRMQMRKEVIKLSKNQSQRQETAYNAKIAGGAIAGVVLRRALEALGDEAASDFKRVLSQFDENSFDLVEKQLEELCSANEDKV